MLPRNDEFQIVEDPSTLVARSPLSEDEIFEMAKGFDVVTPVPHKEGASKVSHLSITYAFGNSYVKPWWPNTNMKDSYTEPSYEIEGYIRYEDLVAHYIWLHNIEQVESEVKVIEPTPDPFFPEP